MENCLVEKLKETVNDSNLRKLGEMRIQVYQVDNPTYGIGGTQRFTITPTEPITLTCIGGTFSDSSGTPSGTTLSLSAIQTILIASNGNFQISIPKKTAFRYLSLGSSSFGVNLEELYGTSVEMLLIGYSRSYGNIKYINRSIQNLSVPGTDITGDIADLGRCTNLTGFAVHDTEVYGSLEELAESQVANGRTSGTISCTVIRSSVTYQGQLCTANHTITFNPSASGGFTIS